MKTLMILAIGAFSFSAFATNGNYDETCAKRYMQAAKQLVATAEGFNAGQTNVGQYAASVAGVDAELVALGAYCFYQNGDAQSCVANTKPGYKKIRAKMNVRNSLRGNLEKIKVSELDLARFLKGNVAGFLRGLGNGSQNICVLD
ncbi:MAG: hypothetical protein WEB87_03305 [Bacteriovoracaceae bacterium]